MRKRRRFVVVRKEDATDDSRGKLRPDEAVASDDNAIVRRCKFLDPKAKVREVARRIDRAVDDRRIIVEGNRKDIVAVSSLQIQKFFCFLFLCFFPTLRDAMTLKEGTVESSRKE